MNFDDAVASAHRAERRLARHLAYGTSGDNASRFATAAAVTTTDDVASLSDGPPLDAIGCWPELVHTLEGVNISDDASTGSRTGTTETTGMGTVHRRFYPLEDGRSRVQGLMTAMSITRMILLSGTIITKAPTR